LLIRTWTRVGVCSGGVSHPGSESVSCTFVPPTCTSFTYSDWTSCVNNVQTRSVLTSTPTGCVGGSPVLSQACTVQSGLVYFRTSSLSYSGGAGVAFSSVCGGDLVAFGETGGACSEFSCGSSVAQFMVPFSSGSTKAWLRSNGVDFCVCYGSSLPRRFNTLDSDASKVSTSKSSITPTMELTCS
jgi:hypothetical protein